jgi:hypothetical protein
VEEVGFADGVFRGDWRALCGVGSVGVEEE